MRRRNNFLGVLLVDARPNETEEHEESKHSERVNAVAAANRHRRRRRRLYNDTQFE